MDNSEQFRQDLEEAIFPGVLSDNGKTKHITMLDKKLFEDSLWGLTNNYLKNNAGVNNTDKARDEFDKAKDKLYQHYQDIFKYAEKAQDSLDKVHSSKLSQFGRIFIEAYKELFYKIASAYKEHKVKKNIESLVDRINGDTWSQKFAERLSKAKLQVGKAMNDLNAKARKLAKNLRGVKHHGATAPHTSGAVDLEDQGPKKTKDPNYVVVKGKPDNYPEAPPVGRSDNVSSHRVNPEGRWGKPLATVQTGKPGGRGK